MNSTPETHPARFGWLWTALAWLVAAGILCVYVATAAPNAWWGDGMELATAARVLGVAHPTGYPLYMVVGHIAIRLMGWMEPGRATTILNAILLAAASGLTILLLLRVMAARNFWTFAIAAGLAMIIASGTTIWEHATITEVYPLTYVLCVAVMRIGWTPSDSRPGLGRGIALGAVTGLASLNHYSILALYPLVALLVLEWSWRGSWPRRAGYVAACFFSWLVMLAGFVYLPLRARANPGMNWGDPRNLENMMWVLSGGQYRMMNRELWQAGGWRNGSIRWMTWWGDQWLPKGPGWMTAAVGVAIMAPAIAGLVLLARRRPAFGVGLMFTLVATFCYSVYYQISDIDAYFLPALPALAVGWVEAGGFVVRRHTIVPRWLAVAPALLAAYMFWAKYPAIDKSFDVMPDRYAAAVMNALPRDAVLLLEGDNSIFSLWYYQTALGKRPDVSIIATGFLLEGWYERYFEAAGRPRPPVKVISRDPTTKLEWDIDLIYNAVLPCLKSGKRVFVAYDDVILEQYFSPRLVATVPPGPVYRKYTKPNTQLPTSSVWELTPNPALAAMSREEFRENLANFYIHHVEVVDRPKDE